MLILAVLIAVAPSTANIHEYRVSWTEPSSGPGRTIGNKDTFQDAMPLGNGALTALAWANVTNGGIGLYIGHQAAMSSHTELFKLALVQVALSPNPFDIGGRYFNQTIDLSTGTVLVYAGGSPTNVAAVLSVWVDANSDTLFVDISSPSGTAYSLTATVASVRPSDVWTYVPPFWCANVTSQPDVFVDPVPATMPLHAPAPQTAEEAFRHASGHLRPTRTLSASDRLPPFGAFQPGSVIIYHRNEASDGFTLKEVLTQQGIEHLIATTPDWWQDNQFGFVMDGGSGPPLTRVSHSELSSSNAGTSFQLRFTVLAVQTPTSEGWLADLSARVATAAPHPRLASEAWWANFWARSYITVNASQSGGSAFQLSQMLAITRYTQAVQSRGTIWPIKFNGMAFVAAMDRGHAEADYRDWGPANWWQNTRLPYGTMILAGDFEHMRVVLDYYVNMEKLLGPRTIAYWNHTGMWTTETHHLSGAYDPSDYGCGRPQSNPDYPVSIEQSGYLHVDQARLCMPCPSLRSSQRLN
jgi:hypothetical protein